MNKRVFILYTGLGGAIWMAILIAVGYFIGANKELMMTYMPSSSLGFWRSLGC